MSDNERVDEENSIIPVPDLEAAKKGLTSRPITRNQRKTNPVKRERESRNRGYYLCDNQPNGPIHHPPGSEQNDDDNTRRKRVSSRVLPIVVDGSDEGETDRLTETLQNTRRQSIKGYFHKESHTVTESTLRSSSKTVQEKNVSNRKSEADEMELDVSQLSDDMDCTEELKAFMTKQENAPVSSKSAEAIARENATAQRTSSSSNSQHWEEYINVGEKMLMEWTVEALEQNTMLPDLNRLEDNDFCLVQVNEIGKNPHLPPLPRGGAGIASLDNRPGHMTNLPWNDGCYRTVSVFRELKYVADHGLNSIIAFENLMSRLHSTRNVDAVKGYYKNLPGERSRRVFLELIRCIAKLALRGPELFPIGIPLCSTTRQKKHCSVTMSQEQCACLLACAFFGIFAQRKRDGFNTFTMVKLFHDETSLAVEKLRFLLAYFSTVLAKMPAGCVSFRRTAVSLIQVDQMQDQPRELSQIGICAEPIETCHHALQVDFANKFIGGGVLTQGAVQEEIRFLCCPEMIVSLLLCPKMEDNEAIFIVGAQQYSSYEGYGKNLKYKVIKSNCNQEWDKFRRIRCEMVAIDARSFDAYDDQYRINVINREILKAYVGFMPKMKNSNLAPVATGNWGCGVFNGDLQLKCIIQLIAASMAGRDIIYCPFDKKANAVEFCRLRDALHSKNITQDVLYQRLLNYRKGTGRLFAYLAKWAEKYEE